MYDLKYCKLCLATDIKMSSMSASIHQAYMELLRLPFLNHEPYVCYECAAYLLKFQKFYTKCHIAHNLLTTMLHGSKITKNTVRDVNRKIYNLESKLGLSPTSVNEFPQSGDGSEEQKFTVPEIKVDVDFQHINQDDDIKVLFEDNTIDDSDQSVQNFESIDHIPEENVAPKKGRKRKLKTDSKPKAKPKSTPKKKKVKDVKIKEEDRLPESPKTNVMNDKDLTNESETNITEAKRYVKKKTGPKFKTGFFDGYATVVMLTPEDAKNEVLLRKESSNYINCAFKCSLCFKGYEGEATFQNHMKRHSPEFGDLVCEFCHLRFPEQRLVNKHEISCHRRKFYCKSCPYICFSTSQAKAHISVHKGKIFPCEVCGEKFSRLNSMLMHRRVKHVTECVCELCGSTFVTQRGLQAHKKLLHRNETNEGKGQKCEECDLHFATELAWKRHRVLSSKHKVSNGCECCGETFASEDMLKEHMKLHSRKGYNAPKMPTNCAICKKWLTSRVEFKRHMTSQHPQSDMARRIDAHDKVQYICEVCGKEFNKQCFLNYHMRKHTGERPYKCDECGKTYSFAGALSSHRLKHQPKRVYPCHLCQKVYAFRSALDKHIKNHLGIRPHKCAICGKAFLHPCELKLHIKYTHDKVPWPKRDRTKRRDKRDADADISELYS